MKKLGRKVTPANAVLQIVENIELFRFPQSGDNIATELAKQVLLYSFADYLQRKNRNFINQRSLVHKAYAKAGGWTFSKIELRDFTIFALYKWQIERSESNETSETVLEKIVQPIENHLSKLESSYILSVEQKFDSSRLRKIEKNAGLGCWYFSVQI